MKTYYECEVCHRTYDSAAEATACEARPLPDKPPVGVVFKKYLDMYPNITFATADMKHLDRHNRPELLWACRDNGMGDNFGKDLCGNGYWHGFGYGYVAPDPREATFIRMVTHLTMENIPVQVWNGEKIVPLSEFLASFAKKA